MRTTGLKKHQSEAQFIQEQFQPYKYTDEKNEDARIRKHSY